MSDDDDDDDEVLSITSDAHLSDSWRSDELKISRDYYSSYGDVSKGIAGEKNGCYKRESSSSNLAMKDDEASGDGLSCNEDDNEIIRVDSSPVGTVEHPCVSPSEEAVVVPPNQDHHKKDAFNKRKSARPQWLYEGTALNQVTTEKKCQEILNKNTTERKSTRFDAVPDEDVAKTSEKMSQDCDTPEHNNNSGEQTSPSGKDSSIETDSDCAHETIHRNDEITASGEMKQLHHVPHKMNEVCTGTAS